MGREAWSLAKYSKNFNVNVYRRGLICLIISLSLSVGLSVLIFYFYLHQPERDYYATSGETSPIKLQSMLAPNESSVALLPPDPPTDDIQKAIPQ